MMWVCDWTHWQNRVVPAVNIQAEGFGAVKLKIGGASKEGWSYIDPFFLESADRVLESDLVPSAYWYLMPGFGSAQAAIMYDLLTVVGGHRGWALFLDVEQHGLRWEDVETFWCAWRALTMNHPLAMYTSRRYLLTEMPGAGSAPGLMFPVLEEAHWVSSSIRANPAAPYASQHAKGIDPVWWDLPPIPGSTPSGGMGYGGWVRATMLQFTDCALVDKNHTDGGKRVPASIFQGTKSQYRALLTRD